MAFVVVLQGGSPWGFRLIGGKEFGVPLRIAKINPGSKAAKASIEVGDIVYSINGQSTDELEHNDALSLVKSSKDSIELHLRRTTSPLSPITNTSTIYRSTSNGPTEDSSEEQSEDMTETTTKTVMMNSDQGSIADYEDSLMRAGLVDVDLQNLPSNVAVVKKTTTKVTKITRCTSPARWSSSESLTSTEGDRKRERQQPPITVQVSSAAEPGSDSPKLLHVWSPPLSGGEASPVSPPFPTNSHLQVPEQVQQTATKSDVTKLIKEIDSRPPHPPPRHSGPDVKRAYYTDQSAVASPPTRRKKVKTTLFIRPRSNSFDATTSRSWTPVNFKAVSKDDNERTLTSPPPTVPPPPQMYEYYPVITQGPKTVKTSLILQPEANRRRARDRRAFTPLARSTSVPPQLDMTDESAAVPKINPAAVPQNTYTDPTSPPTTTTLDSLPLPSPPPPLTMSDNAEVVTNHEPLEPVKVNANPISPKPGVWTPGQPSSTISTDSFNKDRDANFNVAPVWKPFGGDMPKKEFKAVKLELNSDKPKETDIPPPPPPPPMPSESYAWRPPTPPAKEEPPAPEAPKPAEPPSPQNKGFAKYQPNGPTSSGLPSTVSPTITLLQHNRERRLREAQSPPPSLSPPLSPKPKTPEHSQKTSLPPSKTASPSSPPPKTPPPPSSKTTTTSTLTSTKIKSMTLPARGKNEPVKTALLTADRLPRESPNVHVITDANQLPPGAVYQTKTVEGDVIHTDTYYPVKVPGSTETTRRVVRQSGKYEGIGPVDTESGMPIGLRSGVQEDKRHDWYKEMYKSIHRQEKKDDEDNKYMRFVREGVILDENPYRPTYIFPDDKVDRTQKEYNPYRPTYVFPEGNAEPPVEVTEKDVSPTRKAGQQWAIPSARNTIERYQQQPRSITDYEPGKSSLAAKEKSTTAHMHNPPLEKTERAKSPPYISGSRTLPASYRRSDQVSPRQTQSQLYPDTRHQSPPAHSPPVISHDLYKNIQKGGDIPIHGLRKPEDEQAPAQNRYSAGDLYNYRGPAGPISPSSNLNKERIIEEERMRKKEQEKEQDRWRRHSDNSPMKSPIITNERFEDPAELARQKELQKKRAQEVKVPARALYSFSAQNAKELSFKKGDVIYIIRQVDKNWLEGEHHGRVGIFPTNYVEAIQSADIKSPQPVSNEGKGQAKYNFKGETNMELSLNKGDSVILIRKVDNNWYEGKLGNRQGIFPASYIEVITEPVSPAPKSPAPAGYSPQHSPAMRQQQQQQQQQLSPVRQQQSQSPPRARQDPGYPQQQYSQPLQSQTPPSRPQQQPPPSHPPTHAAQPQPQQQYYPSSAPAPLPAVQEHFRAIYPYAPQNEDELELFEGDVVVVMEKCDDGWFVGTSTRTGQFGTFPGNYVERM